MEMRSWEPMLGPSPRVLEQLEVMLEKISAHKYSNMVAERRLTAMMLQEAGVVELIGRAFSPNTTRSQEREVEKGPRELTAVDPVLPCWGSSGGPGAG